MRIIFVLFIVLATSSFAIAADQDQTARFERIARIDQFVGSAPLFIKNKSLPEIRAIGALINEIMVTEPSKYYPGRFVEYRTLQFDGLVIYGRVSSSGEFGPITITISKSQWHILYGLDVGVSVEKVRATLGPPTKQAQGAYEYCGETECAQFLVDRDKVTQIELRYYAD